MVGHPGLGFDLAGDPLVDDLVVRFPDHDVLLGGASLVQLRMGEGESAKVQPQPALPAREQGPVWIDQIVETAVAHISAGDFEPKPSEDCRFCHFKASCPTTNSGTGVIL